MKLSTLKYQMVHVKIKINFMSFFLILLSNLQLKEIYALMAPK